MEFLLSFDCWQCLSQILVFEWLLVVLVVLEFNA